MRIAGGVRWVGVVALRPLLLLVRTPVAVAALAALALSACQDPAGVGLGLIDEEQSDPAVRVVLIDALDTLGVSDPAIGIAAAANPRSQPRVLTGAVVDPVFGDAASVAYVDALQPQAAQSLDPSEVAEVWLELPQSYTYGDAATPLPVELRQVQGPWDALASYPSDTTFAVGPALVTVEVDGGGDTYRFTLPPSWVRANAATLVGDSFGDDFEGFALQAAASFAPAPGAVYGFTTFPPEIGDPPVGLRVRTTDQDTLTYPLSEVFSSITTRAPAAPPLTVLPLRRNSGADLRFAADLSTLGAVPLARGVLRLPADTTLAQDGAFVRPLAATGALFGVREVDGGDPVRTPLGTISRVGDDYVVVDSRALTASLQQVFLSPQTSAFTRFEVRPSVLEDFSPASLDVLPLLRPVAGMDRPPRFTLTVVGAPVS